VGSPRHPVGPLAGARLAELRSLMADPEFFSPLAAAS
jgi:hypothetical protein